MRPRRVVQRSHGLMAGLGLALAAMLAVPRAGAEPLYTVELCCELCPLASNPAAYNSSFLRSFTMLVQGEDGWLFRSEDELMTRYGPDEEGFSDLRRLRDAFKARGVDLVLVYQPPRALMHADKLPRSVSDSYNAELARSNYAATLQRFRDAGLIVPDLSPLLAERNDDEPFFFRGDHHWTPYGARRTARIVAEAIRQLPSYEAVAKKDFVTARVGVLARRGTFHRAVAQICGFGHPDQYVDQFSTAAHGDLLDDEAGIPQVTLLGTSNSDSAYNFAGFLSEYLKTEVLNESVAGGGYYAAMQRYLPSEEFQKHTPKVVIWEIEPYHNLSKQTFYRQVVPLVNDGCRGRKPILQGRTQLRSTSEEVLFNGGGEVLTLASRRHLIDVQFADPSVSELRATVWYTNGSKETIQIKNSEYLEAGGRFVTELRDDPDWGDRTFMSMDLSLPEGVTPGVDVSAQLCARLDAGAPATRGRRSR